MGDNISMNVSGDAVVAQMIAKIVGTDVTISAENSLPALLRVLQVRFGEAAQSGELSGDEEAAARAALHEAERALALPEPSRRAKFVNALRHFRDAVADVGTIASTANQIADLAQKL